MKVKQIFDNYLLNMEIVQFKNFTKGKANKKISF